jgi:hypothetical protein
MRLSQQWEAVTVTTLESQNVKSGNYFSPRQEGEVAGSNTCLYLRVVFFKFEREMIRAD